MIFRPKPCPTRWEGAAVSLWVVLIDLLLLVWALRRPVDPLQFVVVVGLALSLPLLAHLLYRTWAAFNLEYWVDRNAVTIRWANARQVIPMPTIQGIMTAGLSVPVGRSLRSWPLPYLRLAPQEGMGEVNLCATRPAEECVVLETATGLYALSPADPQGFVAAVQERFSMGPTQRLQPQRVRRSPVLGRILPADRLGRVLLLSGAVGVLLLFGVVMVTYPNLPDVLTVRYNSAGLPEEIRAKSALFRLPVIGLLAWSINGLVGLSLLAQQQRIGAYMLWGGAVTVEIVSLLALISLIA